jgi:hypothetical protein
MSHKYKIEVCVNNICDESDNVFKIIQSTACKAGCTCTTEGMVCPVVSTPSITVLSPNGGGAYKAGDKVTVKRKTNDGVEKNKKNIWINLNAENIFPLVESSFNLVTTQTLNDGIETFTIPNTIPAGRYKMAITAYLFSTSEDTTSPIGDESDNYFTIENSIIVLPVNHKPSDIATIFPDSINAGESVNFTFNASDEDRDDLSWSIDF